MVIMQNKLHIIWVFRVNAPVLVATWQDKEQWVESRESGKNDQARINYPKSHTARASGILAGIQRARGDKTFKEMFVHLFVDGMQTATPNKQCNSNVIKFIGLTLSFVCAAYFWLGAKYFHVLNGCILFHVKK